MLIALTCLHPSITPLSGGIITTVAGDETRGYTGDGGLATSAGLYRPRGVAVDASGKIYIADTGNGRIRLVNPNGSAAPSASPTSLPSGKTPSS